MGRRTLAGVKNRGGASQPHQPHALNRARVIWIIHEGSPGHLSQSQGLVHAIAEKVRVECRIIESKPKIGGAGRALVRWLMGSGGRALPDRLLHGPIGLEPVPADSPAPDLILSSGGKSVFAARSLAVRHNTPYILIGERKPYPATWFHTVLTPSSLETAACDVRMDFIPTKITRTLVHEAASRWRGKPEGRLWAMLIGGRSRSHAFENQDWLQLADGMARLAQREGIRWMVTTSRRTGGEIESLLRQQLPSDLIADAVWWNCKPEKKLAAYLGSAEAVFVTQDSVSMITEAVVSTRPVIALAPRYTPFPATSYMPGYLDNLEAKNLIRRFRIAEMTEINTDFRLPYEFVDPTASLAEKVCARLGW